MCGYYVINTLRYAAILAHHLNWSIHLQRHHLGPLLMSSLDNYWVNQLSHSPFLTYAHKVYGTCIHVQKNHTCHYNYKTETILALAKERRKAIRKNTEETTTKENDRKKEYWACTRQQHVHVLSWMCEPVSVASGQFRHRGKRQHYHQPTAPPTHFGLHYVIACNSEVVSCMFSHCDQCWELITVDMLGVVAARPGCNTILMT